MYKISRDKVSTGLKEISKLLTYSKFDIKYENQKKIKWRYTFSICE